MIVYKITNNINGKVYIGQTVQSLNRRWRSHYHCKSHCYALNSAIQKYGKENFTIEQIDTAFSREELDQKETYWIKFYNSMSPNGYNLTSGGNTNHSVSKETRKRLSESLKGVKNFRFGKKFIFSEEHKHNMSISAKKRIENKNTLFGNYAEKHKRKVQCIDTSETFNSVKEASLKHKVSQIHIIDVCRGRRKTCGGVKWKYVICEELVK